MNKHTPAKIEIRPHQLVEKISSTNIIKSGERKGFPDAALKVDRTIMLYNRRKKILCKYLGASCSNITFRDDAFLEIDLLQLTRKVYGEEVANYLNCNYRASDLMLLFGDFYSSSTPEGKVENQWEVIISLSEMDDTCCAKLGKNMQRVMSEVANKAKKTFYHTKNGRSGC